MSRSGPKRPRSHELGQAAEQAFAAFVTRRGCLWHPSASGSDYGIDGRVEIVAAGHASGIEFAVQVKGAERLGKAQGRLTGLRASSSTVDYWLSHMSVTLVVAYDFSADELYAEWAHAIPGLRGTLLGDSTKSQIPLSLSAKPLDDDQWRLLIRQAFQMYREMAASVNGMALNSFVGFLYLDLADIQDILFQIVYRLAYVWQPFATPGTIGHAELQTDYPELSAGLTLAGLAASSAYAFANGAHDYFPGSEPLIEKTSELDKAITAKLAETYGFHAEPRSVWPVKLMRIEPVVAYQNLGRIAALLRDFNRELRPMFFAATLQEGRLDLVSNKPRNIRLLMQLLESEFVQAERLDGEQ
jgi:hypothetical protein